QDRAERNRHERDRSQEQRQTGARHSRVQPVRSKPCDDEQQNEQRSDAAREKIPFACMKPLEPPEFEQRRTIEESGHIRAEARNLEKIPMEAEEAMHPTERPKEGYQRKRCGHPSQDDINCRLQASSGRQKPRDPQDNQHWKEEEVVEIRQRLHQPCSAEDPEPAAPAVAEV